MYTGCLRLDESAVTSRFLRSFGDENSNNVEEDFIKMFKLLTTDPSIDIDIIALDALCP